MMHILPYQNQQNSHDMILLHNLNYVIILQQQIFYFSNFTFWND